MNLTSPSQVKDWCIANGFHPNKVLGQNFLVDRNSLDAIVAAAGDVAGQRVLEIGPGLGVLTEALLAAGAEVLAVEKDTRLAGRLSEALGNPSGLLVVAADALRVDWDELLQPGFCACVSNLPYSVGTRILLDLAFRAGAPERFVLLVQSEVAERFAAPEGSPHRGQAGVWLQLDYDISAICQVPPTCFWPRPEVDSTVVRLDRHPCGLAAEERKRYFELTKLSFMHRRKQLGALLRKAAGALACSDAELSERLKKCGLDPKIRPEELSVSQWESLATVYAAATT